MFQLPIIAVTLLTLLITSSAFAYDAQELDDVLQAHKDGYEQVLSYSGMWTRSIRTHQPDLAFYSFYYGVSSTLRNGTQTKNGLWIDKIPLRCIAK